MSTDASSTPTSRLHVVLLSHWVTEQSGGNGVAAAGFSEHLARLGARVTLVAFDGPGGHWIVDETSAAARGFKLIRLRAGPFIWRAQQMLSTLSGLVARPGPPAVLWVNGIWNVQSLVAGVAGSIWRIPYVVHPAGSLANFARSTKRLKKTAYFGAVERHVLRRAAAIHCLTEKEVAELPGGLARKGIVVPLGIDVPHRPPAPREPSLVGVLARLHPIKNHDRALDVIETLVRGGSDLRVEFAGAIDDLAYERRIRRRIDRSPLLAARVDLLGHVPRIHLGDVVGRWRAALLLSEQESFGHAVITAAALGVPTVVSPGVGLAAAVAKAGAGAVAPASGAAQALARLLDSDPDVLAETCRRFASGYRWESCAQALLQHLNSVVERGVISPPA